MEKIEKNVEERDFDCEQVVDEKEGPEEVFSFRPLPWSELRSNSRSTKSAVTSWFYMRWLQFRYSKAVNPLFRAIRPVRECVKGLFERERSDKVNAENSSYGWHFGMALCGQCNAACCRNVTLNLRDAEVKLFPKKSTTKLRVRWAGDWTKYQYSSPRTPKGEPCCNLNKETNACTVEWDKKPMACRLYHCAHGFHLGGYYGRAYEFCINTQHSPNDRKEFYKKLRADIFKSGRLPELFRPNTYARAPLIDLREVSLLDVLKDHAPLYPLSDRIKHYRDLHVNTLETLKDVEKEVMLEERKERHKAFTKAGTPAWDPEKVYLRDDKVEYKLVRYIASGTSTNSKPNETAFEDWYPDPEQPGSVRDYKYDMDIKEDIAYCLGKKIGANPKRLRSKTSIPGRRKNLISDSPEIELPKHAGVINE